MARDWASVFNTWAQPVSTTEGEKCERAERMIRNAIAASEKLKQRSIRVFPQGSYRNDTNVRQDSDVDICVCCTDVIIPDYTLTPDLNNAALGYTDSSYTQAQFKNEVGEALTSYFGADGVTRGDKAFDVHANTVRVDADVVPTFEHRLFYRNADRSVAYHAGTNIKADSGKRILNFPQQHYDGGCAKNVATDLAFKRVVRIMKRLRNEMAENGIAAATPIPSFLVECLVWNVPHHLLKHDSFYKDVQESLRYMYHQLKDPGPSEGWLEVNCMKLLFHTTQPWTREQALAFVLAAWTYVGFE